MPVSGRVYTLLCVVVTLKLQIQQFILRDYTDDEVRCMYTSVNITKHIRRYTEFYGIKMGNPAVNYEDNKIYITIVKSNRVIPRIKNIVTPLLFYVINIIR